MENQLTKNTSFFYTCKENYFLGILPTDPASREKEGYRAVVQIAKTYFSAGLYEPVAEYLTEGRYRLKLWSAYLILEYGNPDEQLKISCMEIVQSFTSEETSIRGSSPGVFLEI
jgi:hypothetical protein